MTSDWIETTLGDYIDFKNGRTSPDRSDNAPIPVYGSNGIIGYTKESNAPENSLIIGRVGSYCGSVYHSYNQSWITDNAILGLPKNKDESEFWYFLLLRLDLNNFRSGSGQPLLNQTTLNSIPIQIPNSSNIRVLIGKHLMKFDEKIELNRQINQTLEQIAQAIFKSWFIDFEPVKAKVIVKEKGGNELAQSLAVQAIICGATTLEELQAMDAGYQGLEAQLHPLITARFPEQHGLDYWTPETISTLAAYFPNELVDSDIGVIPQGWSIGTLNDICMLNVNSWTQNNAPNEIWYVDLANTKNGVIEEVQYFTWDDSPSRARRIVNTGDTIIGTVRPGNRSYALIGSENKKLTASTGFAVLTPKSQEYIEYVYIAATSDSSIERLAHLADGAAYPAVRPDVVISMEVVLPHNSVFKAFSQITRPMFLYRDKSISQAELLANCCDSLLPKLLSGEITFDETEPTTEDVA